MSDVGGESSDIINAGLILTAPFLPRWFQTLDMLERAEDGRTRIIPDQISRAVHLLESLVDVRMAAPEPLLCLNKPLRATMSHESYVPPRQVSTRVPTGGG